MPNKIFKVIYNRKSILSHLVDKLKTLKIPLVIATSSNRHDKRIIDFCKKNHVEFFVGSENNLNSRFYDCANQKNLTHFIRVCSDNPFLSLKFLNDMVQNFDYSLDYLSFITKKKIPVILTHYGFFAEIISVNALKKISILTNEKRYYEHISLYILENLDKFNTKFILVPKILEKNEYLRLTVDTVEDFNNISEIYKNISDESIKSILSFLRYNNSIRESMKNQILKQQK